MQRDGAIHPSIHPRPIPSFHNQLTRLNAVSTMSLLETSPTSTRPASTANFILIPLMGIPGLSAMAPDLPSFPSPAVSIAGGRQEGRGGGGGGHR